MIGKNKVYALLAVFLIVLLACNAPISAVPVTGSSSTEPPIQPPTQPPVVQNPVSNPTAAPVAVTHVQTPSTTVPMGEIVNDVDSSETAPEKRAPYGDSYNINLLERPFLQDMTYVPDLDITDFYISSDSVWYYVSIKLVGNNPNNSMGINYGVELDTNKDGFGDFIVWAHPTYTNDWTTTNVQVFADKNHDTSGLTPDKSDAPFSGDGYETLVFDGAKGFGDDPDLAWVRMVNDGNANIQFAFKKSLSGDVFMAGVVADAGLKDVTKFDYVDRFTEADAGSPIRNKQYYPLKALYAVDNTCRQAVGFTANGTEPMTCVKNEPVQHQNNNPSGTPPSDGSSGCSIKPSDCNASAPYYWPYPHCACSITPYHP